MSDKKPKKTRLVPRNLERMEADLALRNQPLDEAGKECRDLIEKATRLDFTEDARLSIDQAATMLGVSKQTLRNWEKSGKLVPERTEGGHRRYREGQVNVIRKQQLGSGEIILPDITPARLKALGEQLLASFLEAEKINLIISQDVADGKLRITIDSEDGLTTVTKTFNVEE
jgi:excisionase family DNA binding protein